METGAIVLSADIKPEHISRLTDNEVRRISASERKRAIAVLTKKERFLSSVDKPGLFIGSLAKKKFAEERDACKSGLYRLRMLC